MFFTASFIVLCASLLSEGAVAAPRGLQAAPDADSIMGPYTVVPSPSSITASGGSLHPPLSIEGPYDHDTDRHPVPHTITSLIPLPSPVPDPTCPGGGNSGSGTSSSQVIIVVQTITTTSNNLNTALSGLTTSLQLGDVTNISKVLIQGFTTIVASLAKAVATFPGTPPFGDNVTGAVVDTLVGFVRVHQALLATVIGKHSIFAQFALTAPIVAVLRTLEAGVDAFAFALIGLIPTKRATVQAQINTLDLTLKTTVNTYSQVCFSSPKYPQTKPTCIKVNSPAQY